MFVGIVKYFMNEYKYEKHMWPVTLVPPKSIEGFILTFVDKHCATKEIIRHYFRKG